MTPSEFGKFLSARGITDQRAAEELDLSLPHVRNLALGKNPPRTALAFRIEDWARKEAEVPAGDPSPVPVESWRAICRRKKRRK